MEREEMSEREAKMPSDVVEIMARGMESEAAEDMSFKSAAQAAIAALREAGYVIAPVVPSEAMIDAGVMGLSSNGVDEANNDDAVFCYTAMIAAMENDDG